MRTVNEIEDELLELRKREFDLLAELDAAKIAVREAELAKAHPKFVEFAEQALAQEGVLTQKQAKWLRDLIAGPNALDHHQTLRVFGFRFKDDGKPSDVKVAESLMSIWHRLPTKPTCELGQEIETYIGIQEVELRNLRKAVGL